MSRVILSPKAESDLKEILEYIEEQSDEERAERVLRKITRTMGLRASQPLAGRKRNEIRAGLRGFVVYQYVIFYQPLNDGIHVLRVLFGGRDLESIDFDEDMTLP